MATPATKPETKSGAIKSGIANWFGRLLELTPARRPSRFSRLLSYAVAIALVMLALSVRILIGPPEIGLQFVTFFPAVALAAIYGGFWPGMLASVISSILATYLYIPPFQEFSFEFQNQTLLSNLAFFVDELMVCAAIQAMHTHHLRFRTTSEHLVENRNLLHALISGTTDTIFMKDQDGRFTLCNDAHLQTLGKRREEIIGRSVFDIFPTDLARTMSEEDQRIIINRKAETIEHLIRLPGGEERSFLTTKGPIFDDAGKATGIFGISRDITERARLKEQLQQQHDRLEEEVKLRTEELTRSNSFLATSLDTLAASLKEANDLYQNAPCGYHSLNADGLIVKINDTELSWLGYTREEVVGKKYLHELITPERAPRFRTAFSRVKETGTLKGIEGEFVRKDGSIMPTLINVSAVRDEHGKFLMSRATVYDNTERKKTDETLRFHSEILKNLLEAVFLIRASDGTIVFTNPQLDRMFGYAPGELIGKHVSIVNAPGIKKPEVVAQEIIAALDRDGKWAGDVGNVKKDGTPFWCHARVSAFDHAQYGKVWVSMHEDITAHKQAEHVEKRLNRALRLLSECNTVLVHAEDEQKLLDSICRLVVDTGGYLMAWVGFAMQDPGKTVMPVAQSGAAEEYLKNATISWADTRLGRGPTGTAVRTGITQINQDTLSNPNTAPWREAVIKLGYKSSIALPLFGEGRILGALTICSAETNSFVADEIKLLEELASNLAFGLETLRVRAASLANEKELKKHRRSLESLVEERTTELAYAKMEAERANNAKSRFLAAASHDLRQPLSALKLYAGVLKGKLNTEDQTMLANMEECVASLGNLLSKLLDLSKLEAGVVTPRGVDFSLDDMLNKVIATYAPKAEAKGLSLRCGFFGVTAHTDPVLFQRIIGNLVDNAIHYTRHGGVLILCRRHRRRRWIEVWDTGIGIPDDKIGEIFEEFKQLGDEARTQGSGLGLTIAAKTASLLGLGVRVHSRVGHGSMFAIELPLSTTRQLAPQPKPKLRHQHARIAVVDDNPFVLNALVFAMENAGHKVVAAANGKELLNYLGTNPPDIMVCDYRLACGETGYDVITAARQNFGKELPAVIITGDTDPALMRSMAEKGIAIQHKPVEYEDLQARIDEALKAHNPS